MRPEDYDEFAGLLDATFDIIGKSPAAKQISPGAKALFFEDMRSYPLALVRSALAAHRGDPDRGKFTPSPSDLIFQIDRHQQKDSRPGPEEAFALALTTLDEQKTVIWTQECATAFAKARPVLDASGAIAARKTFTEIYERLVTTARKQRQPAAWFASPGLNKDSYVEAVKRAVAGGLLLPAPEPTLKLEGPAKGETFSLSPRQQLDQLHAMIEEGFAAKQARLDAAIDGRISAENATSAEIQRKVDQRLADESMVDRMERAEVCRAGAV